MTEMIEKEYYGANSPVVAINDMRGNGVFKIPDAPEGVDTSILDMVCGKMEGFSPELLTNEVQTWFLQIDRYLDVPILGLFGREGVEIDSEDWWDRFVKCSGYLAFLARYRHDMSGYGRDLAVMADWAAMNGHLETLKWIRENGGEWTSFATDGVASYGHLETLKWIRENGGEWTENAADRAAMNGHLKTLKWIRENGGELTEYATGVLKL